MSRQSEARKTRRAEKRTGKMKVEIIEPPYSFAQAMDSALNAIENLEKSDEWYALEPAEIDWSSPYAPRKPTPEEMEIRMAESLVMRILYEEDGVVTFESTRPGYRKVDPKMTEEILTVISRAWEDWKSEKDRLVSNGIAGEYLDACLPRPEVGLKDYYEASFLVGWEEESSDFHKNWREINLDVARTINEIVAR